MWEEVLKLAVGNGMWAVLSCALLTYLVKDSRRREQKYTDTIDALLEKLRAVSGMRDDIKQILGAVRMPVPVRKPRGTKIKLTAAPAAEVNAP